MVWGLPSGKPFVILISEGEARGRTGWVFLGCFMSNYSDLLVSFFSLVKNNDGFFKSEKQAAFMLKMTDGHYVTTQQLHFGEYDARTRRNTAMITWSVILDNQGVVKMEKTTSKGTQVYFERTQEYLDKLAAQKAARMADIEKTKALRNEYLNGKIDELKSKIDAAKKNMELSPEAAQILKSSKIADGRFSNMHECLVYTFTKEVEDIQAKISELESQIER